MLMNSWLDFNMAEWSIFMNKLVQASSSNNLKYFIRLRDKLIYDGAKHDKKAAIHQNKHGAVWKEVFSMTFIRLST